METRTITGEELVQAKNYSAKFWANPENAPSKETLNIERNFMSEETPVETPVTPEVPVEAPVEPTV